MRPTASLASKPSKLTRLRLTTKQVNKGYYKGNRTGAMGWHTKHGAYVIDPNKVRTYKVPASLKDFKLTPFVTRKMDPTPSKLDPIADGSKPGRISGERYLWQWQQEGGTI